jgi:hypothetical protein
VSLVYCVTISGRCRHIQGPKEYRTWCGHVEAGLVEGGPAEWADWPVCGRCERSAARAQTGAMS